MAAAKEVSVLQTDHPIPILRIFDEQKALQHYIKYLGFVEDWKHVTYLPPKKGVQTNHSTLHDNVVDKEENGLIIGPSYRQISLPGTSVRLHLTEHHGDSTPGSTVYIPVMSGLRQFHSVLQRKSESYPFLRPSLSESPGDEAKGGISLSILDPFGNTLRFDQRVG